MTQLPVRKMSMMLVLVAVAGCFLDADIVRARTQAQEPVAPPPSFRQPDLGTMVKLGDIYVSAASPNNPRDPGSFVLEIGGKKEFWDTGARTIVENYLAAKLEVRYLIGQEDKPPFAILYKDGGHQSFDKKDFPESDLPKLARKYPLAVKKLRVGEMSVEMLAVWLYKFGDGMLPEMKTLPDLTEADFDVNYSTFSKPVQYVFYRSKENLAKDPTLPTKELQEKAWVAQEQLMRQLSANAIRFHGLLRVRKVSTDQKICGKHLYEAMAPGAMQGQPVVVVFWGNTDHAACERFGPFKPEAPVADPKAYADFVDKKVQFHLNLDTALTLEAAARAEPKGKEGKEGK